MNMAVKETINDYLKHDSECDFECQEDYWQCRLEDIDCEHCNKAYECKVCINSEICKYKEDN